MQKLICGVFAVALATVLGCASKSAGDFASARKALVDDGRFKQLMKHRAAADADEETADRDGDEQTFASESASARKRKISEALKRAYAEEQVGDHDEAAVYYEKVLDLDPDNASAHHQLAVISDVKHDYEAAERHYEAALLANPNDAKVLNSYGYSLLLQGRYPECEHKLLDALEQEPEHEKALTNLAVLYAKCGEYDRTLDMLRRTCSEEEAQEKLAQLKEQTEQESEQQIAQAETSTEPTVEAPEPPGYGVKHAAMAVEKPRFGSQPFSDAANQISELVEQRVEDARMAVANSVAGSWDEPSAMTQEPANDVLPEVSAPNAAASVAVGEPATVPAHPEVQPLPQFQPQVAAAPRPVAQPPIETPPSAQPQIAAQPPAQVTPQQFAQASYHAQARPLPMPGSVPDSQLNEVFAQIDAEVDPTAQSQVQYAGGFGADYGTYSASPVQHAAAYYPAPAPAAQSQPQPTQHLNPPIAPNEYAQAPNAFVAQASHTVPAPPSMPQPPATLPPAGQPSSPPPPSSAKLAAALGLQVGTVGFVPAPPVAQASHGPVGTPPALPASSPYYGPPQQQIPALQPQPWPAQPPQPQAAAPPSVQGGLQQLPYTPQTSEVRNLVWSREVGTKPPVSLLPNSAREFQNVPAAPQELANQYAPPAWTAQPASVPQYPGVR